MALPPRNLDSRAACSLELPSPYFSSLTTTQLTPASLYFLATLGTPPLLPLSWFLPVFILPSSGGSWKQCKYMTMTISSIYNLSVRSVGWI